MKLFPAAYWAILMLLSQMATASPLGLQGEENAVGPRDATPNLDERNVLVPPKLDERDAAALPAEIFQVHQLDERDVPSFDEPQGENLHRRQRCWPELPSSIERYFTHPWTGLFGDERLMTLTKLNNKKFSYQGSCKQWNTRKDVCKAVCEAYYGSCPYLSACWRCKNVC